MTESVYFTWNLFVSPVFILILGIYINRLLARGDKAHELRNQRIDEKFKEAAEQFVKIDSKLTRYCIESEKKSDELWRALSTHGHKGLKGEDGEVTIHI